MIFGINLKNCLLQPEILPGYRYFSDSLLYPREPGRIFRPPCRHQIEVWNNARSSLIVGVYIKDSHALRNERSGYLGQAIFHAIFPAEMI